MNGSSSRYNENFNKIFGVDNMNRKVGEKKETQEPMTDAEKNARAAIKAAKEAQEMELPSGLHTPVAKKGDLDAPERQLERLNKELNSLSKEIDILTERQKRVQDSIG